MRIALLSPFSKGPSRGNITTVNRIFHTLSAAGHQVYLLNLDETTPSSLTGSIRQPLDIIHCFHAYYCGPAARNLAADLKLPYIITITGSDLFEPAFSRHHETIAAIESATAVTCFDHVVEEEITKIFPSATGKTVVIPQGVEPFPTSPEAKHNKGEFNILLPAAIRPVKGIIEAVELLDLLSKRYPAIKLIIAGGEIDTEYAAQLREKISGLDWVKALGDIPHEKMGVLYSASDVVLNSSLFEGGMPNSLLEAMAMSRPVVAADIKGNRSIVRHGETGWIYKTREELEQIIAMLIEKPDLLESAGRAAHEYVISRFDSAKETGSLLSLYSRCCKIQANL